MDEASLSQQYYIAAGSSPSDDRTRVLKYGKCFAVFNRYGDIEPLGLGEHGIFFQGTRHISELSFSVWESRPLLLSSTVKADNLVFTADVANVDVSEKGGVFIERGTLHIVRSRFLWKDTAYEQIRMVNHGLTTLNVPLRVAIAADFADIFEVRGMSRDHRGHRLADEIKHNSLLMTYEGLDKVIRQTAIISESTPTKISSSELCYEATLAPRQAVKFHLSIVCDPAPQRHSIGYERAITAAETELKAESENNCEITSSNDRLSRWIRRSLADVQMMILGNPETNYPYGGVPWFSTVFGRDGIITALEMLWVAPSIAKGVLQYLSSAQATEVDPENEAQPGKILHETRRGEMANLGEVPFGRYYGSIDSTPLFVMLAGAYFEATADFSFIKNLWPHIDLALEWIDRYGDSDGDGFIDYARHGSKGLIQQGWKDSSDSIFHADGKLADAPIALCEVQGYVYAAKMGAARICAALGNEKRKAALEEEAAQLQDRFEKSFWCEDLSTYAIALDGHKQPCRVRSSNPGHCLFSGIVNHHRAGLVVHTLLNRDFFSGWGVRTIGYQEARYNPLSYHNGSVWPHDNAIIAAGMARYGYRDFAGRILMALLDVSGSLDLHRLPELFCGVTRRVGEGPTLYPVACSPQSWAAGAVFLMLQACLGITIDGAARRLIFDRPYLPEGIPQLSIRNLRILGGSISLLLERDRGTVRIEVTQRRGDLEIVVK